MEIHFEATVSEEQVNIARTLIEEEKLSLKGYKVIYLDEDDMECTDWDEKEKNFIDAHKGCDFFYFLDCKAWEQGQLISLVAVLDY